MFTKTEGGAVTIPHPEEIGKAIKGKVDEVKALRRFQKVAYTAHNVAAPEKKAKKAKVAA